ncbi:TetR/AcrR family transcriptional regulator [[Mycobacterium] nativiensis]|uniref:TetR/AcrR family transcriptional regulator n=1 Tax=[Mycobacterium] nativiensis TaxID=2855503 RepID=A0ABU5XVD9_9MYCO|nr:TetR/AcrR family transcriptional regulator [Mycolicibacter sp. MYC340]MEB3031888.1 TetR/AcrR family transcriptional regulator [Mycolicibacter sp. MYC340]
MVVAESGADVDAILDVALTVFAELGLRRATVDDVAKRAGIGRVTIYRRIGGKPELIRAVLARESQRLFADVSAAAESAGEDPAERIAVSFATTVAGVRENPVWQRLLSLEPDTVLPQLTMAGGDVLAAAVTVTIGILDPKAAAAPSPDLTARAEVLVRITHSVLLTSQVAVPLSDFGELAAFARRYLVPIAG